MRILLGLFWALVGGVAGLIVGAVGASIYASATHMSNREGASSYFTIAFGLYTAIPVVQGPFYRSGSRVIVVRVGEKQVEAFMPPIKRTPDPKADWSEWYRATAVDPPYGVTPAAPLKPMLELRYRVRKYGD